MMRIAYVLADSDWAYKLRIPYLLRQDDEDCPDQRHRQRAFG